MKNIFVEDSENLMPNIGRLRMNSKHLLFEEHGLVDIKRKTKIFYVRSKFDKTVLGEIRWYSGWRQYVLMPYNGCVWSWDCLTDASIFIKELMDKRKEASNENKSKI